MAKPIFIVSLTDVLDEAETARINKQLVEKMPDYHVLISAGVTKEVPMFQVLTDADRTIQELKDIIKLLSEPK